MRNQWRSTQPRQCKSPTPTSFKNGSDYHNLLKTKITKLWQSPVSSFCHHHFFNQSYASVRHYHSVHVHSAAVLQSAGSRIIIKGPDLPKNKPKWFILDGSRWLFKFFAPTRVYCKLVSQLFIRQAMSLKISNFKIKCRKIILSYTISFNIKYI